MDKLYIIKVGGSIIDDEERLAGFLQSFAQVKEKKILVHGGGKLATRLAEQLHIPQQMVEGRRITDSETLKVVTMVYAGWINKIIVAKLIQLGCVAMGITGVDGNAIQAHKRTGTAHDYGWVGDTDSVQTEFLQAIFHAADTIVVAPITHDGKGQLLNTNADTIAQELAKAMSDLYDTTLVFSFEKAGVLMDAANEHTLIPRMNLETYEELKGKQVIFAGMIPKLDNAFAALKSGVGKVVIGKAEQLEQLITGTAGTTIIDE